MSMCLSESDKPHANLLNDVIHGSSVNFYCLLVMKLQTDAELTASQFHVVSISTPSVKAI